MATAFSFYRRPELVRRSLMWFSAWLRTWFRKRAILGKAAHRSRVPMRALRPAPFRPRLELLEGRDVPSTLTVYNNLDSGPGSLRSEIAAARSGDTIVFDARLSGQTIKLTSGELLINKSVTIEGPGADQLTVSGGGFWRVFEVDGVKSSVTLSGLTISQGNGVAGNAFDGLGGGVLNFGTLTISACTL